MIAEFKVKNYCSVRDEIVLSFIPTNDNDPDGIYTEEVAEGVRLLKMACIYGSNASGKSTLLNAFSFLCNFIVDSDNKKGDSTRVEPFRLDDKSYKEKTEFTLVFYLNREKYILNIILDSQMIYHESLKVYATSRATSLYERTYNETEGKSEIKFSASLGLSKKDQDAIVANTIPNRAVMAAFGISNVGKTRLDLVYKMIQEDTTVNIPLFSIAKKILKKDNKKAQKFILEFLKMSDFNISNIQLKTEEEPIPQEMINMIESAPIPDAKKNELLKNRTIPKEDFVFTHHTSCGDKELDEDSESAGTKRYLGLATMLYILLSSKDFCPIDELETSIHPELLSYFIRVFLANSQKQSQLVFTTHNVGLLDEDYIRRDMIWFADKDQEAVTHLRRLSSLGLHNTMSVLNAYKQNKLVNIPFVGEVFLDDELFKIDDKNE